MVCITSDIISGYFCFMGQAIMGFGSQQSVVGTRKVDTRLRSNGIMNDFFVFVFAGFHEPAADGGCWVNCNCFQVL